ELIELKIAEHRGRIVKNTGDGFLAEFGSVVDAVRCAVEVQRGMAERNVDSPPEKRIEFRIGINLGDVIVEEHDIFGDGVNVTARLEALAEPGGICVSRIVRDQVRDKLDFVFEDLGEQQVKNIARPVRVYRVRDRAVPNGQPLPAAAQPLPPPDKPSIAVLPFQNMTGDPEQDYFVDGIVEEITTAISRLPWLFVIARNSSFTYKGRAVDVKQAALELGVRYVLEGSVRRAGNRVRITGQLIDTTTGVHIWADRFDRSLDYIFELQDQIASSVVGAIEPKLRLSEIQRATRKPTESLDAYDLHLRALAQLHKYTEEGLHTAITLLKQALAIDPSYAPPAAMIGRCRIFQRVQSWGPLSDAAVEEGVRLARQAIEVSKDDPDALWMAATTLSRFAGEHDTAASIIDRSLTLNPNSAYAWMASGQVSCYRNLPDRAIEALQRAMRLSPLDPLGFLLAGALAFAYLVAGRYEDALEWADRSLRELPRYSPSMRIKVVSCAQLGRIEKARYWLERLRELQPGLTIAGYKALAMYYPPAIVAVFVEGFRKAGMPEE
ncbi:MAG TPA: adenylate/guanylate cyclase domain-containing protein, partial [Capsulimonadaceae bacterium]|nr:adenylate/guanylate cyclase domain-containing protein [Capsulimonadaceae bacterium]